MLLPPRPVFEARLASRAAAAGSHFMPPALLDSQLALVEEAGEDVVAVVREEAAGVGEVARAFGLGGLVSEG
jgi:gluconate kinase